MKTGRLKTITVWLAMPALFAFTALLSFDWAAPPGGTVESAAIYILFAFIVAAMAALGAINHFVFAAAEIFQKIIPHVPLAGWAAAIYILLLFIAARIFQKLSTRDVLRRMPGVVAVPLFNIIVFFAGLFSFFVNRNIFMALFLAVIVLCLSLGWFLRKRNWKDAGKSAIAKGQAIFLAAVFFVSIVSTGLYFFKDSASPAIGAASIPVKTIYHRGAYDAVEIRHGRYILTGADRNIYVSKEDKKILTWEKLPFARGGKPEVIELADSGREVFVTGKPKRNKRIPAVWRISADYFGMMPALHDARAGMVIDIDVDEKRHKLYLLNEFGKKLFVYDSRTFKPVEELKFDVTKYLSWPYAVETDSTTGVVYVSSFLAGNRLYRIDPATKKVTSRFLPAMGLAVDERRGLVYAARPVLSRIDVLDAATLKTKAYIPAGAAVRNIELSPGGKYIFAGEFIKGTVTIIDLDSRKNIAVLKAGKNPRGLHYNPVEKTLIVSASEKVVSYDMSVLRRIP